MEHWDLTGLDVEPHRPQILDSKRGESRTIALRLPAGEALQEHQVHERAHVIVVEGEVEIGDATGGPGLLAIFEPVVAMLKEADLIERGETDTDAYIRIVTERYLLLRTHDWSDEVLDRLRTAQKGKRRTRLPPKRRHGKRPGY